MRILLILALTPWLLLAQQSENGKKAPNNKYAIAAPTLARNSGATAEAIVNALVQRLTAKSYVREPILDVQCCAIQVEIVGAAAGASKEDITARITLLDIDQQNVYNHVYTGAGNLNAAAAKIADSALADKDFLKKLAAGL